MAVVATGKVLNSHNRKQTNIMFIWYMAYDLNIANRFNTTLLWYNHMSKLLAGMLMQAIQYGMTHMILLILKFTHTFIMA